MRVLGVLCAGLTLLGSAGFAGAQDDPFQRAARETELGPLGPAAVLFVTGAFGRPADSYSFYVYWDPPSPARAPGRERRFAVRKASRTEADARWASSKDCPALVDVLARMEEIPAPRIDFPGVGESRSPNMVLDGVTYDLSVRWAIWDDDSTAYMLRMSGNVDTPLAAWAGTLGPALDSCWTLEPPLPVRPPR